MKSEHGLPLDNTLGHDNQFERGSAELVIIQNGGRKIYTLVKRTDAE
jgi:hypothetical protein